MEQITKHCNKCGTDKPLDQFSKCSKAKDGLQFSCKACNKKVNDKYRVEHPEWFREWYNKTPTNKEKFIKTVYKSNAALGGGIYAVMNLQEKKVYIGQTTEFRRRRIEHFSMKEKYNNTNKSLAEDVRRLGREAFDFLILEKCEDLSEENLIQKELKWIGTFKNSDFEFYNAILYDKGFSTKHRRSEDQ